MHLLAAIPGRIDDGAGAVDLAQDPAEIVVLSAADSEIALLAAARGTLGGAPSLRLANLGGLQHHLSVDLYVDKVIAGARLVIVRLLGGRGYWSYGVDRLVAWARERQTLLALLPGDDRPDAELATLSTVGPAQATELWQYLVHGGAANAREFLRAAAALIGHEHPVRPPAPLLRAGLHLGGFDTPSLADWRAHWQARGLGAAPVAALVFYRALVQAADTAPIDALAAALAKRGLRPLPLHVASLKDADAAAVVRELLGATVPDIVLNATGFALADEDPLAASDCPVLQVVLSSADERRWRDGSDGLPARDLAMSVALPEIDGRILSRAIAFKDRLRRDPATQADLVGYRPVPDRIDFVADLAAAWVRLRRTPADQRRVALVLANYPNRDGRIGNGVGLDTPQSTVAILDALQAAGYRVDGSPATGARLMDRLLAGPTNAHDDGPRTVSESLSLADYAAFFAALPAAVQAQVTARWGRPSQDPAYRPGELDCGSFRIAALRFGNIVVAIQPARGYNIDPSSSYHDPALVPPHGYLAFHAWLRDSFRCHAIVHVGKHGNLEWLPGKSLALSAACFPEAALGALPHLYPFIVNDPGEGTQAKRRAGAVIIDHLTPPLTRAGSHGAQAALERLIDEYYEASSLDPRRLPVLAREIRALAADSHVAADCGIAPADDTAAALRKLDGFLCELKEQQIRDGLHVFGRSPDATPRRDLLVAIARGSRGSGQGRDASLARALARDLALGFDPLDCDLAAPWQGPRPDALAGGGVWRSTGDTVDRLERLAADLVDGTIAPAPAWTQTAAVLDWVKEALAPAVDQCGAQELDGLLHGLAGRRVSPGPSGAPSRGRPDVLPTGRNFYSVDTRAVPTPAAWQLGWAATAALIERYTQDHGAYPRTLALSAWGTSAMRTGGDDIAQALALIGAKPTWDPVSRRVTGFEILPLGALDRPRVDVTLRISGFFRDAFPGLIDLFDSAVRAVAALDEPAEDNPLAAQVRADTARLAAAGRAEASREAAARVFGSRPGAYGAGLQALIDERGWRERDDLARAYLAWGGYRYGGGARGEPVPDLFEARLARVQAVLHNQDNREHDLLDSDDYYQFEGGLSAAVEALSGAAPAVYHGDNSRPDAPRIRSLAEEIARVVRARASNPRWIAGVMRHGYKGAAEIAATVDYLFAFAATTSAVANHQFDALFDAYLGDDAVRGFIAQANPAALSEIAARFEEACARNLWQPRSNSARDRLARIRGKAHA